AKPTKQNEESVRISLAELFHHVFVRQISHSDNGNAEGGSRGVRDDGLVIHKSTVSLFEAHSRASRFRLTEPAKGILAVLLDYTMPGTWAVCTMESKKSSS